MDIKTIAEQLVRKCYSRDPFDIANQLHIKVLHEPLGTIRGFYSKDRRQKFIHINNDLPDYVETFVCAHELGHAILHPNSSTPFLRKNTIFSINRMEQEANHFAVFLLLSDEQIKEYAEYEYTIAQISCVMGLPESLVAYRTEC